MTLNLKSVTCIKRLGHKTIFSVTIRASNKQWCCVTQVSRLVIPKSLLWQVILHMKDTREKFKLELMRQKVWYCGIDKDVNELIISDIVCQATGNMNKPQKLKMFKKPWSSLTADFLGPVGLPTGEYVGLTLS